MKGLIKVVTVALLIVGAAWAYCAVRDRSLARNFEKVSVGMPEEQVQVTMGKPTAIEACGSLGGSPKNCSKEYRYNTPYPVPYAWVVFIDSTGHVIDKDLFASW
jgi:hypothetical protein